MIPRPGSIGEAPLNSCDKGLPGGIAALDPANIASHGWNILREDLPLPIAVLKQEPLNHNLGWMRDFARRTGVELAPHGKTTMSPRLFDLQLAHGAWAITLATPHQVQVARHFGYSRIFLANQLVGRSAIQYVFAELAADSSFEFYCLVDSIEGVEQLVDAAQRLTPSRPICVLVEMGYPGGRTGCRTIAEGLAVARAVSRHPTAVTLRGVEAFEGLIRAASPADTVADIESFLERVTTLASTCEAQDLFSNGPIILSAGGSAYFDIVVKALSRARLSRPVLTLLRSGCYLSHDSLMYTAAFDRMKLRAPEIAALGVGLRPVIEIWAYVHSRPEARLAIVGLGKRDISHDDLPLPLAWFRPGSAPQHPCPIPTGHRTLRLNDQHAHLEIPEDSPLAFGDMVSFGISHPCLTFDKWRVLHVVDADYYVVDSVRTYF